MSDEKLVRLENLVAVMTDRKMVTARGRPCPTLLKQRAGFGGYSFWAGILNGSRSFGEDLARRLEDALGLPRWYLDGASSDGGWPFRGIDKASFDKLTDEQKLEIQGIVRRAILDFESSQPPGHSLGKASAQPRTNQAG